MHEATPTPRTRAAIVGAGRAGRLLGRALAGAGLDLVAASSRSAHGRTLAARALGIDVVASPGDVLAAAPELVLLCVPDDSASAVVEELVSSPALPASPMTVVSVSGSISLAVLDPLRSRGHRVARMHPLAVLSTDAEPRDLRGAVAAITGHDEASCAYARELASMLGMQPVDLADDHRGAWHAAASVAGNFPVTLVAAARDLAMAAGLDEADALAAMTGLARGALERAAQEGPEQALTGPVSRGDAGTVAAHVGAVERFAPQHLELYRALGAATLRLAMGADRLDDVAARAVEAALAPPVRAGAR